MGYAKILALDLGKFKSVGCAMDVASKGHAFATLETNREALKAWVVAQAGGAAAADASPSALVVFEACDAAGWVHDLLAPLAGVAVTVVNCNDERWRWRRVKRKTDRDDALKLARLALLDELPSVHVPAPDARQRRRLMLHRRSVVTRRTQCRNAIRSIFSQQGIALARGNKQWTRAGVEQLKAYAKPLAECAAVEDLWRGRLHAELELMKGVDAQLKGMDARLDALAAVDERTKLLRTMKGVGPRLAEAVVLHLDDPHRFRRGEEVAGYAGLVPKQIESGQMSRRGHITRRGPALLRSLLVEAAWSVWRHNEWAKLFVEKISRGGRGRRKLAIVALARKILVVLWGMLKSSTPFRHAAATADASAVALE
jgi:transposase